VVPVRARFRPTGRPVADPANILTGDGYRITVLDDGLVRLEYSPEGVFEDRASQAVVDRAFPPVDFDETGDRLTVRTARLQLGYDKRPFSTEGLTIQATGGFRSGHGVWRYGLPTSNLGGTARTLDGADGAVGLEPGILSADGVTVHDDSRTVLLTDDGWITRRRRGTLDLYVFAYGRDYRAALRAFYRLTGPQPLLPRFALGNWWSRFHRYSADSYLALMDRFAAGVPLSVAVIDMDWHLVDIDPRHGSGWTGYTWNHELFGDPAAFLAALHERGLGHHAQRAPGRRRARPRGAVRRAGAAVGHGPRERAADRLRPGRPGVPRGVPRGAAPPAGGRGRRLLVAGLAAGRGDADPRARPAVAAQPLPLPGLRPRRPAAAHVLPLRGGRQPPLSDRVLRGHRDHVGVAGLPARSRGGSGRSPSGS
jgi:Glycosyl hydrolases family 31/Domain of unknown function (DUF4968)